MFVDNTLTNCYPSCPANTYPSTIQLGFTGIFYCMPCDPTCLICDILPTKCIICDIAQNRYLDAITSTCIPMPHFFEAGLPIAQICDPNCY